jgi:antitoxin (DNA-binding transcriptional repressor) of toxin-antitoxin stability system
MKLTATRLRQNIYAILDEVIETGVPVEIERKGKVLQIVPEKKPSKFDRIPAMPTAWVGDPEDIFKIDWLKEWGEPAILDAMERKLARQAARKLKNQP